MRSIFYLFIFLLPFLPALNLSNAFDLSLVRVFIFILCFCFVVFLIIKKGNIKVPFDNLTLFLLLFLFWSCFSFFYSETIERTLRKNLVFISIFPLYFITYGLLCYYKKEFFFRILKVLTVSSVMLAGLAGSQFFLQFFIGSREVMQIYFQKVAPFLWGQNVAEAIKNNPSWLVAINGKDILRTFGSLPDPHMLSFYFTFTIPLQLFICLFYFWKQERQKAFLWMVFFLFSLVVELLTFSRGGYLGLTIGVFVGSSIFLVKNFLNKKKDRIKKEQRLFLKNYKKYNLWKKMNPYLFLIIGFSLLILAIFSDNFIIRRFISSFDIYEGSNLGRLKIWQEAFDLFLNNMFFGVGLGAYSYEIRPALTYRDPVYAHNIYLEVLVEEGIIGFIFFIGIFILAFIYCVQIIFFAQSKKTKTIVNNQKLRQKEMLGILFLVSLIWFLIHSFFEMPIFSPVILSLLMIFFAMINWYRRKGLV